MRAETSRKSWWRRICKTSQIDRDSVAATTAVYHRALSNRKLAPASAVCHEFIQMKKQK